MSKKRTTIKRGAFKTYLPFAIIAAVLLIVLGIGTWLYQSALRTEGPARAALIGAPGAAPPRAHGPANAPVTLEEFGDYQCPPCGTLYPEMVKIEAEYGDRLRLIYRHYPHPAVHPNALLAAHAAEAAGFQDHFWQMHDQLYRNQTVWSRAGDPRPLFIEYARGIGLDADRFVRDMDSAEADARIVADHERAKSLGIETTPTILLNGQRLPPATTDLRSAINEALKMQQQQ